MAYNHLLSATFQLQNGIPPAKTPAERQDLLHGAGGHRPPADYVVMVVLVDIIMVIGLMGE